MTGSITYLRPVHPYAYRNPSGDGRIVGLPFEFTPKHLSPRLCYEVHYPNGMIDYVAVSEIEKGVYNLYTN